MLHPQKPTPVTNGGLLSVTRCAQGFHSGRLEACPLAYAACPSSATACVPGPDAATQRQGHEAPITCLGCCLADMHAVCTEPGHITLCSTEANKAQQSDCAERSGPQQCCTAWEARCVSRGPGWSDRALLCRSCEVGSDAGPFERALGTLDASWDPGPSQQVLLSGAEDGSMAAWQLPTLDLLLRLSLHLGAVSCPHIPAPPAVCAQAHFRDCLWTAHGQQPALLDRLGAAFISCSVSHLQSVGCSRLCETRPSSPGTRMP